jgi:eukaryotic-like serine/threonine-protein kinase
MSGPLPPDVLSARPADLLGRTIGGKFLIEAILGAGAMGVVYRARQTGLDKVVAIKVMHTGLAFDQTFAARFHREAKAASRLDHPNSIRILDFGQEPDGLLYIAMDYLDGRDLLEVITDEWPLSVERMVDILSQALSALAVAHDLGVLHRDLKPENIMVLRATRDDGRPGDLIKVCDFGIAKIIETNDLEDRAMPERANFSTAGIVVGTPAYMSPEQARGETVDARSDVYAMGVILYQMLTMRVPFDAPTALSTLLRLLNEEPQLPSALSSRVNPELESVCLKAMSKKPADRYQGAREMRSALRDIVGLDTHSKRTLVGTTPVPSELAVQHAVQTSPTADLGALAPELEPATRSSAPRRPWAWGGAAALIAIAAAILASRMRATSVVATSVIAPSVMAPSAPVAAIDLRPDPSAAAWKVRNVPAPSEPRSIDGRSVESPAARPRKAKPLRDMDRQPNENPSPTEPPVAPAPVAATPATPARSLPASALPGTSVPSLDPPLSADPSAAHVDLGSATATVGTTAANVNKAVAPVASKLNDCYRAALAGTTRSDGPATMHLETNEDGVVTDVRLSPRIAPSLAACFAAALRGRKIPNVDTGRASADVPIVLKR